MDHRSIVSKYAVIGDHFELAEDVYLEWDESGKFTRIEPKNPSMQFDDTIALPCFINAHTHVGDAFAKDLGFNLSLPDLVAPPNGLKHQLLRSTAPSVIRENMNRAMEYQRQGGISNFLDFREGELGGVNLLSGLISNTLPRPSIFARFRENPEELVPVIKKIAGIGLPSPNGFSDAQMEEIIMFCKTHRLRLATHVSESSAERAESQRRFNTSDVLRMLNFKYPTTLVHSTCTDKDEIQQIHNAGAHVVLCPQSNAMVTGQLPPIAEFIRQGVPFCLGTDNVMVNAPNLWRELQFAIKVLRVQDPTIKIDPAFWVKAVTFHPAKAMGLEKVAGSLEPGKIASFFLVSLASPAIIPAPRPLENVILRGDAVDVTRVFYSGRRVGGFNAP